MVLVKRKLLTILIQELVIIMNYAHPEECPAKAIPGVEQGEKERLFPKQRFTWWLVSVGVTISALLVFEHQLTGWSVQSQAGSTPILMLFLLALCCEYIDSSLGMGYGTALTPLLMVFGFDPMRVVPCVLLSELVTGCAAGLMHQKDGNVDFLRDKRARECVLLLSGLSLVGVTAATALAISLPRDALKLVIGSIVVAASILVLVSTRRRLCYRSRHVILLGMVAAFNKGVSGGGYGPLTTSGQILSGVPARNAVAITSVAEAVTCLFGVCGFLWLGSIDLSLAVPLTLGALMSVPVATVTIRCFPEQVMRLIVGLMTFLLGSLILLKACF